MYTIEDYFYTLSLLQIAIDLSYYVTLVACAFGFLGNTITAIVYLQKKFREKSLGTYFVAVGTSEQLLLISNVLMVVKPFIWLQTEFLCKGIRFSQPLLGCTSSWLHVLNSIDRTIMVIYPKRMLLMRKIGFQVLLIIIVIFISVAISSVSWINSTFVAGNEENFCVANDSMDMYYYSLAFTLFYIALPFIFMLTCSIIMIVKLKRIRMRIEKSDQRKHRDNEFAKTILALNIYFLSILLPYCVIALIFAYYFKFDVEYLQFTMGQYYLTHSIFYSLVTIYHATSIFVHISANKLFRTIINQFFVDYFKIKLFKQTDQL